MTVPFLLRGDYYNNLYDSITKAKIRGVRSFKLVSRILF